MTRERYPLPPDSRFGLTAGAGGSDAADAGELRPLGLSHSEEAVYELLVDGPPLTRRELAALWGRAGDVAAVLARLVDKGLVTPAPGVPERFEIVPPDVTLDALLLDAEQRLSRARERARQLTELHRANEIGPARDVIELVIGGQPLRQRVIQVQRAAHRELRCLDRPPYVDRRGSADTEVELLTRGVTCRTVYERSALEGPGTLPDVERLAQAGVQGRVLPKVPVKLYLADDRMALLALHREPASVDAALVIHPSGLLDALSGLFEGLWRRALPLRLPVAERESQGNATASDRQRLVALLLSGLTDQAIARQLEIGYRTVQRRIAALMADMDASTRFQAGIQVALRARSSSSDSA